MKTGKQKTTSAGGGAGLYSQAERLRAAAAAIACILHFWQNNLNTFHVSLVDKKIAYIKCSCKVFNCTISMLYLKMKKSDHEKVLFVLPYFYKYCMHVGLCMHVNRMHINRNSRG